MEDRRREERRKIDCTPQACQYHILTESVISDLKKAVEKLMEGQDQMKETVIHLTEAFKAMERIDRRMGQLEELQREKDKEQDCKIDELRMFMYKWTGIITALGVVATILLKFVGI